MKINEAMKPADLPGSNPLRSRESVTKKCKSNSNRRAFVAIQGILCAASGVGGGAQKHHPESKWFQRPEMTLQKAQI